EALFRKSQAISEDLVNLLLVERFQDRGPELRRNRLRFPRIAADEVHVRHRRRDPAVPVDEGPLNSQKVFDVRVEAPGSRLCDATDELRAGFVSGHSGRLGKWRAHRLPVEITCRTGYRQSP